MGTLNEFSQKDRNKIISALVKEIKKQMPTIIDSVECDTLDAASLHYFKEGLKCGLETAIDILKEERCYKYVQG